MVYGLVFVPLMFVVIGTVKTNALHALLNVTPPRIGVVLHVPLALPTTPLVGIVPEGTPVRAAALAKYATTSSVVCAPDARFQFETTDSVAIELLLTKLNVAGVTETVKLLGTVAVSATVATADCVVTACEDTGKRQIAKVRNSTTIFLYMHFSLYEARRPVDWAVGLLRRGLF
jgi:hypothetical protein